jgi:hypothetical protein
MGSLKKTAPTAIGTAKNWIEKNRLLKNHLY